MPKQRDNTGTQHREQAAQHVEIVDSEHIALSLLLTLLVWMWQMNFLSNNGC
jgi:hypothetical protein